MRHYEFALFIILYFIISFLLSLFGILSLTFIDILSYSLLFSGIALVYSESIQQNGLSVFLGSIIFLLGVYFLVSENFSLNIGEGMSIPIILIFAGSGILIFHIVTSTRLIFLIVSIICLTSGMTLFIMNSSLSFKTFVRALIPVLDYLWPISILIVVLVLLLRRK